MEGNMENVQKTFRIMVRQKGNVSAMDFPQNIAQESTAGEPATPWDGTSAGIHTA